MLLKYYFDLDQFDSLNQANLIFDSLDLIRYQCLYTELGQLFRLHQLNKCLNIQECRYNIDYNLISIDGHYKFVYFLLKPVLIFQQDNKNLLL